MGQWGVQNGWDEEDEFGSNQVQLRSNRRSRGPTDSGTYVLICIFGGGHWLCQNVCMCFILQETTEFL